MNEKKYVGVQKARDRNGRKKYSARFVYKGVVHYSGMYDTEREAARAHDLKVLKLGIDKRTNFFKKKLA